MRQKIILNNVLKRKFLILGILGPFLFTTATLIFASFRPDYNHINQFISELGATESPHALGMNVFAFLISGVLVMLFGLSFFLAFKGKISRLGNILIMLFGLGIFVSGIFSCDVGCPNSGSIANNIHQTVAPIAFASVCLGILLNGLSFRKNAFMAKRWHFSIFSTLLAVIFMLFLIRSLDSRLYTGLWQRLFLFTVFLWMTICGLVPLQLFKTKKF